MIFFCLFVCFLLDVEVISLNCFRFGGGFLALAKGWRVVLPRFHITLLFLDSSKIPFI